MLLNLAPDFSVSYCVKEITGCLFIVIITKSNYAYINRVGSGQKTTIFSSFKKHTEAIYFQTHKLVLHVPNRIW